MSDPYIGEIRLFPYGRGAPSNWQLCDGSLLPISEYETLYTLLGTTYGGDGQNSFGVPDLRGRVPIHQGQGRGLSNYVLGQMSGTETVTLTTMQMPVHTHIAIASAGAGTSATAAGNLLATVAGEPFYVDMDTGGTIYPLPTNSVAPSGGNQGHDNTAPTLPLNYCIAFNGVWPSQN